MKYKTDRVFNELMAAPVMLQYVAEEFNRISRQLGVEPVLTRVLEEVEGSSGVHEDYRGIDFRNEHKGVFLYTYEEVLAIEKYINDKFPRNDGRVTCIHHGFMGGPEHFHIQIPYLTKVLSRS